MARNQKPKRNRLLRSYIIDNEDISVRYFFVNICIDLEPFTTFGGRGVILSLYMHYPALMVELSD